MSEIKLTPLKDLKLPTAVLALAAAPDSKQLFAACLDGGVWAVPIESGMPQKLGKHESYASGMAYLAKSNQLLSAGYDGTLRWFSPANSEAKEVRTVKAHAFWSWKMRVSPDERFVASVTGQYLAGGEKYEPAKEREPSVKVFETETGKLRGEFAHTPPVLSVAFSPDSKHLAAANLMGEIRVWDLETGKQVAAWTTPDFTCWGIIKSHHYIGGIFDLAFSPDGRELLACGMGPMVDPMAGNGKQTWQRFAWTETPVRKISQIQDADAGAGLMESLRFHPSATVFLMAGKLAQGKWNAALFDASSGGLVHALDCKMRVTDATWLGGGTQLALSGATAQEKKNKDGRYPDFGHIKLFTGVGFG
ncbi:WD40 repeat domain-containing protein [Armatimonas sp.]|uniref:WD40 repeat domain-containing protein n=1 Tax=Armatimonas sp. TaxID=1872638 RepID=UPI00375127E9